MEDCLPRELARAHRHGVPLSLLYVDLDRLKPINDRLGHAAGDAALRETGRHLAAALRPYDVVARWGGDEFVVLLPGDTLAQASGVAERLRARLEGLAGSGRGLSVTASIGVTAAIPGDAPDDLLRRADRALYVAKGAGRNRVEVATGGAPP